MRVFGSRLPAVPLPNRMVICRRRAGFAGPIRRAGGVVRGGWVVVFLTHAFSPPPPLDPSSPRSMDTTNRRHSGRSSANNDDTKKHEPELEHKELAGVPSLGASDLKVVEVVSAASFLAAPAHSSHRTSTLTEADRHIQPPFLAPVQRRLRRCRQGRAARSALTRVAHALPLLRRLVPLRVRQRESPPSLALPCRPDAAFPFPTPWQGYDGSLMTGIIAMSFFQDKFNTGDTGPVRGLSSHGPPPCLPPPLTCRASLSRPSRSSSRFTPSAAWSAPSRPRPSRTGTDGALACSAAAWCARPPLCSTLPASDPHDLPYSRATPSAGHPPRHGRHLILARRRPVCRRPLHPRLGCVSSSFSRDAAR